MSARENDVEVPENTDVQKAMDSLDHDFLTGETLDIGDNVTHRLQQEQATLLRPAVKSADPVQDTQGVTTDVSKKTANNQLFIVAIVAIFSLVVCVALLVFHPWTSNQPAQSVQPSQTETVKKRACESRSSSRQ